MKNEAICLCKWYHTNSKNSINRFIDRSRRHIRDEKRAHIRAEVVESRACFVKSINNWYRDSSNTQYLFIVAHGVVNEQGEWIGIGSSPPGQGVGRQDQIGWRDLWNVVAKRKKLNSINLIGCKTAEAARAFSPMLTKRANNPHLTVLAETVSDNALRQAYALATALLEKAHHGLPLDEEWQLTRLEFPKARLYYPVIAIHGRPAAYVDVDEMDTEVGMSFEEYLSIENTYLRDRYHKRRQQRVCRQLKLAQTSPPGRGSALY